MVTDAEREAKRIARAKKRARDREINPDFIPSRKPIIELTPKTTGQKIKEGLLSAVPFTKENRDAKARFKEDYPDFVGASPFIGFGPNVNPSGLVGSGKAALSLVPKTPGSLAGTILVGGALFESPTLRGMVLDTPERLFGTGRDIGGAVEDIANEPAGGEEKYPSWLKKLLGIGLGAGVVAGATGLIIDKVKDKDVNIPSLPSIPPIQTPSLPQRITSFQGGAPTIPTPLTTGGPVVSSVGEDTPVIKVSDSGDKKEKTDQKPVTINNNIKITNTNQTKRHTKKYINVVNV